MSGWIKLHRKMLENPICQKPHYGWLWVSLLLLANHKDKKFMWNGDVVIIKEGSVLTGRKELSNKTGIPESTIEDILKYLETQHQIQQQKTTKYRIITIVNWKEYQNPTANPTTKQQQADTNNNDNNDNNIASNSKELPRTPLDELVYEPLRGAKSKGAFLNREREKRGKPPMLKKDPATWGIVELYQKQYRYITGKTPKVSDADYFHVLKMTKRLSPKEMEDTVIWYVRMDNRKFKDHPNLRSIFTEENINKFNLEK